MGQPVVHFEIIGAIRRSFGATTASCSGGSSTLATRPPKRSRSPVTTGSWTGARPAAGSTGGSAAARATNLVSCFYVGVPNVEAALEKAESLGGKRRMGPEGTPGTLVVGQFTDPEGHLIGVAGTE
jgi:hypothetical protein